VMALIHMALGDGLDGALQGKGGGLIGWAFSEPLVDFLGLFLAIALIVALAILGLSLIVRIGWSDVIRWLNRASLNLQIWSNELEIDITEREAQQISGESATQPQPAPAASFPAPEIRIEEDALIIIEDSAPDEIIRPHLRDERLPSYEMLDEGSVLALSTEEIDFKKQIIEDTLMDFGLPAVVTEIRRGPAVTQFGVEPGYTEKPGPDGQPKQYKVRVNQIASLQKDLALALEVPRLRIEAPVPGRGIVGIEVPNDVTSVVRLRPIIESEAFRDVHSPLAVALGKDVAGAPVVTDLGTLPHLLIAGTTGSGKSVCLNALIACLVFNNTPDKLRLVMIDPKKVELIRFNGMPHLLGKVEVEGERVIGVLRWLTAEMDHRYQLFAALGAKHLADFNKKVERHRGQPLEVEGKIVETLPYVVVVIDELADLITMYTADVERTLCRLAQMARATGIHLVVATQRPSTDVITGLIKANFPARASFSVASNIDSRVILDTMGAENLLGKGDMLFLSPDASSPRRVQGCFVSDYEIESIVNHWQTLADKGELGDLTAASAPKVAAEAQTEAPWEKMIARKAFVSDRDEMLEEAIALAQKSNRISTSLIQRRLRVGYPRAARLMEALYEMGLVEDPKVGGKTRRTYVEEDQDPIDDLI
jgi:S-DNA-T family DNA segregation ATPase FtsK/SpoIIIE